MEDKKYKVIVSDRAKRMLGTHIHFMAQANKNAAISKKKELILPLYLSFIRPLVLQIQYIEMPKT